MLLTLILLHAVFDSSASELIPVTSPNVLGEKHGKTNQGALSFIASINNNLPPVNRTYYEKEVNPLRVPNKFYEGRKKKNKITKSPKRTIQKIIKNGRSKSRKIYAHPVTRQPTVPSPDEEIQYTNTQRNIGSRASTQHLHRHKPKKPSKVVRYQMPFHKFPRKDNININSHKRNRRDVDRDDFQRKDNMNSHKKNRRDVDRDDFQRKDNMNSHKRNRRDVDRDDFQRKDNMNSHKRNRRDIDRDDVFIIKDLDEVEFLSKEEDNDVVKAHVQNYW